MPRRLAITFTLRPELYGLRSLKQFELTKNVIMKVFADTCALFVAEFTEQGNIHYHGYCHELPCMYHRLEEIKMHKYFGFQVVKRIKDFTGWYAYMIKHLSITRHRLFGANPIVQPGSIIKPPTKKAMSISLMLICNRSASNAPLGALPAKPSHSHEGKSRDLERSSWVPEPLSPVECVEIDETDITTI